MTPNMTLSSAVWAQNTLLKKAALVVLGSLFIALSAQITVQTLPVPITMQTFAVLVVGLSFGSRLGALAVIAYLLEGLVGLPVFAGLTAGPAILFGKTGGYLFGFVAAAFITGWLAERGWDRNVAKTALAMIVGNLIIYVPGLIVLHTVLNTVMDASWAQIWGWGAAPFLLVDALKVALAAGLIPAAWFFLGKRSEKDV